jgi:hypothetical protein
MSKKKKLNKHVLLITIIFIALLIVIVLTYLLLARNSKKCSDFNLNDCPSKCAICPPCEVCSSISCQTEEYCNSLGFDRDWWDNVKPK